jgi:hypothetical protein
MISHLDSLVAKFAVAFGANRDKLFDLHGRLLFEEEESMLVTPAIRAGLEKAKEVAVLPPLAGWLVTCLEDSPMEDPFDENKGIQLWSTLHVFRLLLTGLTIPNETETTTSIVSAVCRTAVLSTPNVVAYFNDSLEFEVRVPSRALAVEDVASAISSSGPAAKATSSVLPDWMKPSVWPQTLYVVLCLVLAVECSNVFAGFQLLPGMLVVALMLSTFCGKLSANKFC